MAWILLCLFSYSIAAFLVPRNSWRSLMASGIIALIVLYSVDSLLSGLGAFSFKHPLLTISGLPLFYLAASFPQGILAVYFYPPRKGFRIPYIVLLAFVYLLLEIIMINSGNFEHLRWSLWKSFILNIGSITLFIALCRLTGTISRRESEQGFI